MASSVRTAISVPLGIVARWATATALPPRTASRSALDRYLMVFDPLVLILVFNPLVLILVFNPLERDRPAEPPARVLAHVMRRHPGQTAGRAKRYLTDSEVSVQ